MRETEDNAARAQTEPTTELANAKRGYEVVDEHKVLLGKYHSPVRERAIGEGWDEATARAKVLETMAAATAGVPTETGAMTPQSVADGIKRTAAVHIDKGQNDFSIARYAREAISGKLKSGLGSVEAEMHTDAENARTGPALLANEFALPARLMLSDKRFVAAAQRKYGARTIEIGAAGGADGASAYANGAFDEMQLIHALYARSGILPMVSGIPGTADFQYRDSDRITAFGKWSSQPAKRLRGRIPKSRNITEFWNGSGAKYTGNSLYRGN